MKRKTMRHTSISVYPTIAKNLRVYAREFGSVGRAIQIGVEILYERLRAQNKVVGEGISSQEERQKQLKRPMSIDTVPRTEFLIEYLAEHGYESRSGVISACENVLSDLGIAVYLLRQKKKR